MARAARLRRRKRRATLRRLLFLLAVCVVAAIFALFFRLTAASTKAAAAQRDSLQSYRDQGFQSDEALELALDPAQDAAEADTGAGLLVVANPNSLLPDGYTVETATVGDSGVELDTGAAAAYEAMAAAAAEDGVELLLAGGYRSKAQELERYAALLTEFMAGGASQDKARARAARRMTLPGASDHATGLGADILTPAFPKLTTGFAKTEAYRWLCENAARYGFIERYPADKTKITGLAWQPWHWRYVGEAAEAMAQSGQCLEEYAAARAR